jgi:outer membrane protein OmpA-like peptidoglycan-associated protein
MKKHIQFSLIVLLLGFAVPLVAQVKRGNKFYAAGEYVRAITAYEKGLRKKNDAKAMANLADCYRITKNYLKAEEWYAKAIAADPNCDPQVNYQYGMMLRTNGKQQQARDQFQAYLNKEPNNLKAKSQVQALDNMQVWLTQSPIYAVYNVPSLNSEQSDISPAYFNNGLFIVSDRGEMDVLNGEDAPTSGRAFYAIYYAQKGYEKDDSVTYKKAKKLPRKINKEFHNGPVAISGDGNWMAYNRVDRRIRLKSKKFINRPKIFFCERKGSHWSSAVAFAYNSDAYSCAHPSLSWDGQLLYFSSDMPGGFGGKDIWFCKKQADGSWSKPENAGKDVNSVGDEVFPSIRKDGLLFFSSDGIPGLGGLDIFSATQQNGQWTSVVNQGAPLNSIADDFNIIFNTESNRGYFCSNRLGGKGDDDVYGFKVTSKFLVISGQLLSSKNLTDLMPNTKVDLLTKDGKLVRTTTTDAQGNFKFENLSADQSYIVRLNEEDPAVQAQKKYYMADENKLVRVTVMDEVGGKYTFQNLPVDPQAPPQLLADDDYLTIAGNLISDGEPPQPLSNTPVSLKDENGNVVQTATTNAFGAFTFSHIPPDKTYIVAVDGIADPKLAASSRIVVTNKSGKELMSGKPDANGKLQFKILKEDKATLNSMSVTDTDLRLDMRGVLVGADSARTPLTNATVNILDENGKVIQTAKTDSRGHFDFVNLPADQSFLVSVDGINDPGLVSFGKLYIRDETGKIVKTLRLSAGGKFEFRVLPLDRTVLGQVYVDDPWLQVLQMKTKSRQDSLLIIENIYYDYNDWNILPGAEITLEKVVKVMQLDPSITIEISAHTDARSSTDYNIKLSQKRAQAVVDYLVKRGIDKKRLTAVGYGESKLLNGCKDGVECTEDQHAKNRRTEFKINKK